MTVTALEKLGSSQLAVLPTNKLTGTVDAFVRTRFKDIAAAHQKLDADRAVLNEFSGDPESEKALHAAIAADRAELALSIASLNDYMSMQKELFKSRGMSKDTAYKYAIVPIGELTSTGVEKCRIVKRGYSLEPSFDVSDESDHSAYGSVQLPSERFGTRDPKARGKYNDGGYLIDEAAMSIDHSEINGCCD